MFGELIKTRRTELIAITVLAGIYFICGRFGLSVSAINRFAALVWPPSGIALAALLIFGRSLWPGIFIGAFFVNATTGAGPLSAFGVAAGNTAEALLAAWFCTRNGNFRMAFDRAHDVNRLMAVAILCPAISATIGIAALAFDGRLPADGISMTTWLQWWSGDAVGILAVTPLLTVLAGKKIVESLAWNKARWIERIGFICLLLGMSELVLSGSPVLVSVIGVHSTYTLVPILLWGAMRFGQPGSIVASFTISLFAVWNTSHGIGPFVGQTFTLNLLHLIVFAVFIAVTGLYVAAVVSEREMERQLLKKNDAELNVAKEAAEAANLAKSAFLANMSHEIRTPLAAVLGFAELVGESEAPPPEKASYIKAIQRNGELLLNLINDVLDLSKIEAGKMDTDVGEVALNELLRDIRTTLEQKARSKNLELTFNFEDAVPSIIHSDSLRLRQILINVIGNAIKFTSKGSVSVDVKLVPGMDRPQLAFTVTDTGIGISPGDIGKLFAPFSQADSSSKRRHGGTGLGLVLSRRLARLLGGDVILARSNPQEGSTFVITIDPGDLPEYQMPQVGSSDEVPAISPKRLDHMRILLAEDSYDSRRIVNRMLNATGAHVELAENGKQAVEKVRDGNYDIVLMDLQMPVMDGYEAAKEIRNMGYAGKIIAFTAHALESERRRCLESGFDDHMSKPVSREELIDRISAAIA